MRNDDNIMTIHKIIYPKNYDTGKVDLKSVFFFQI